MGHDQVSCATSRVAADMQRKPVDVAERDGAIESAKDAFTSEGGRVLSQTPLEGAAKVAPNQVPRPRPLTLHLPADPLARSAGATAMRESSS